MLITKDRRAAKRKKDRSVHHVDKGNVPRRTGQHKNPEQLAPPYRLGQVGKGTRRTR